jgi:hypothetical protein
MNSNLRTLRPGESKVVLSFREQGRSLVRASDVLDLFGSENSARKVIRNLIRKGWISRIVGRRYGYFRNSILVDLPELFPPGFREHQGSQA